MKTSWRNAAYAPRLLGALVVLTLFSGALAARSAASANSTPAYAFNFLYSTGLADVLKMVDAKVDTQVIVAYVKSSSVAYNPSANEVIALKQRGVPPEVVAALLQRGGEVRTQTAQAQAAEQQYAATVPPIAPYDAGMSYPADYGNAYDAGYPYWSYAAWPGWWYSGWPGYWPNWNFDTFHNHHFHDFDHFNHFDGRFADARFRAFGFNRAFFTGPRFQNFDFNQARVFGPRFQNSDFNRSLGVPSRAIPPGAAFGGGSSAVAFIGRPGGTAGMVNGANFAMHTSGVRSGVASGARAAGAGGSHR